MNRRHYILEVAKEVWTFGHHIDLPDDYDFEGANSLYKMDDSNFETFAPEFPVFENKHPFPLTDLIKHVFTSKLIVSQYMADVLTSFKLPKHRLVPLTIVDKGEAKGYFFLYFAKEDIGFIDFKGSSFNIKNDLDETRTMHFDNLDAFTDFVDESKKRYEEY
ncbi:hypothetical protein, partial [Cesiribacter sp. SM1]|uniref:hypothetical protein n=1 Tax=Cesiribacter sp. SM1 TaxID=2861196 RepID=UPI001CD5FCD8